MRYRIFILFIVLCGLFSVSYASDQFVIEQLKKRAAELKLSEQPAWLNLSYYKDSGKSIVLASDFFLSPEGKIDPASELNATIEAYFQPFAEETNLHPRCLFPARYYWLSQHLDFPDYEVRDARCANLVEWKALDQTQSVSIFLVSGYWANPASTFGHTLLKLNMKGDRNSTDLFDFIVNYGAKVPENENPIKYIIYGLAGGYEAGFTDRYYYTKDIAYSHKEFRDFWDYELELSAYQKTLLVLHIWEILRKDFRYYFLRENCAYRLAQLLNVALEDNLLESTPPWFVPEEMFHQMQEVSLRRKKQGKSPLVKRITFVPSNQRVLYYQLKLLSPDELRRFNAIVRDGLDFLDKHLQGLDADQKILVLDSLLAYQHYRLAAAGPNEEIKRKKLKDQILLARLKLPAKPRQKAEIPSLRSPAESAKASEFGMQLAYENSKGEYLRVNFSPFKKDVVGLNSLEGDALVALDVAMGVSEEDSVFLDRFDLLRIVNLNTLPVDVIDDNKWSWQMRLGVDRIEDDGDDRYDGVAKYGMGRAKRFGQTNVMYWMADVSIHSLEPFVRITPHIGLNATLGDVRAWIYVGAENSESDGHMRDVWGGKIQYNLSRKTSIVAEFSNQNDGFVSTGLMWNW